eukprot:730698-Rhodomonas_salina.1
MCSVHNLHVACRGLTLVCPLRSVHEDAYLCLTIAFSLDTRTVQDDACRVLTPVFSVRSLHRDDTYRVLTVVCSVHNLHVSCRGFSQSRVSRSAVFMMLVGAGGTLIATLSFRYLQHKIDDQDTQ